MRSVYPLRPGARLAFVLGWRAAMEARTPLLALQHSESKRWMWGYYCARRVAMNSALAALR